MSRVLFFVPFGTYSVHNQLDAIFATKLRLEGATPLMIRCDGLFERCDILAWSGENGARDCRACAKAGNGFFESFQLPCVQLREFLDADDHARAEEWADTLSPENYLGAHYEGLPVGLWVISSVFSYFRIIDAGLVRPEVRKVHRGFLKSALLTYWALTRLIARHTPDAMVIFNGPFAPYRVAFEVSQLLGIHEVTHERGYYDDSFFLFDNCTCLDTKPLFDIYEAWKDSRLNAGQLKKTQTYLLNREKGFDLNYPAFFDYSNDAHEVRHLLRIPADARVLVVFTSGESESAYSSGYSQVFTQFEKIDKLMEIYRTRSDYLVIRHHPHMAGNSQEPAENLYLTRAFQQGVRAPANVRVVMPAEMISSYALMWSVDAALAFFSSAGFEAAGRGLGVAAMAESPFSKAMRYLTPEDFASVGPLIDLLYQQTDAPDREDLRRAYRFIYSYIYRLSLDFRSFGIKNTYEMDLRIQDTSQLARGHDPELDRAVRCLLEQKPVLKRPGPEDAEAPEQDEEEFLGPALAAICSQRQAVKRKARLYAASRLEPEVAVILIEPAAASQSAAEPPWLARSRHDRVTRYRCRLPAAGEAAALSLTGLSQCLASVQEEYVLVASPRVYYDEAFISSGLALLLGDTDLKLKGVCSGAWSLDADGLLEQELLTKMAPRPGYRDLVALNAGFADPLLFAALTLFRKGSLGELIDTLLASGGPDLSAITMEQLFGAPGFHKTLVPLAYISQN